MSADQTLNHEYLKVAGLPEYTRAGLRLLLGADSPAILANRVRDPQPRIPEGGRPTRVHARRTEAPTGGRQSRHPRKQGKGP